MGWMLHQHGADPDAKNRYGNVPLVYCAIQRDVGFTKLLLGFKV